MAVCVNCHIRLLPAQQPYEYLVLDLNHALVLITEEWIGQEISENDRLCQQCVDLVIQEENNRIENSIHGHRQFGHTCVCISCGISLSVRAGRRRFSLLVGSVERNFIENYIFPRQIPDEAWACNACWCRARRSTSRSIQEPVLDEPVPRPVELSTPNPTTPPLPEIDADAWPEARHEPEPVPIILPSYKRTADTSGHCFVPHCRNVERLRVPYYLKRLLLSKYKLYITPNARVCSEHSVIYNWDMLSEYEFTQSFTSNHVEKMLNLLNNAPATVLNFENVENISDMTCKYWTGLTVINFLELFSRIPQLEGMVKKPKTALGIFLVKLRTGESLARIASLFLLSKTTIFRYIIKARNCLTNFYVPSHLGINHLSREQHSAHNLLIPQGIFGTDDNNPMVICDGTYIYFQKSSNYSFQKKTYSLHKYRNLVKPFLIVTCDGYIIDAFGPYAATQSDADIMKMLFQSDNSPLRSYFRENDIFILDRGFRDSLPLLNSLGYSIYKPESLGVGERQLSTIKANKSRLVTMCRWVVEVVNGRFKRDFKVFRGEYFNVASKNFMTDFKIAAALINNFHPLITNHPNAEALLERALERLSTPNELANYIIEQNINRHRANFVTIDGQLPQLDVFPVMDTEDLVFFALGSYQIKQARSYYGEHIRENGTFVIEVDDNLERYSSNSLIIRGRIKSRHLSTKIYYTYILLDLNARVDQWRQRIAGYYCSCIIGRRTVGSCAHVMTIVWYLGWARYQETILPPASFLDNILLCNDDDDENEEN